MAGGRRAGTSAGRLAGLLLAAGALLAAGSGAEAEGLRGVRARGEAVGAVDVVEARRRPLFSPETFLRAITFRNPFADVELPTAGDISEPFNILPLLQCALFGTEGGGPFCEGFLIEGLDAPTLCISIC